jgi:hypothetical protein
VLRRKAGAVLPNKQFASALSRAGLEIHVRPCCAQECFLLFALCVFIEAKAKSACSFYFDSAEMIRTEPYVEITVNRARICVKARAFLVLPEVVNGAAL